MKKLLSLLWPAALLVSIAALAGDEPRKIKIQTAPEYPEIAQKMNLHGTVKLKLVIASDGQVRRVEYIGGHPLLADAAIKAVKLWRYEPGSAESLIQIDVKF